MNEEEDLKNTIKALRKNLREDNARMDIMDEMIEEAKIAFYAGKSASEIYNILTRKNK
jgi:hypothetical protein